MRAGACNRRTAPGRVTNPRQGSLRYSDEPPPAAEWTVRMKAIGIGVVGGGYAGWLHGCAYGKISRVPVRMAAVCDIDLESAGKTAKLFGFAKTYEDYDRLLGDDAVDIIDICTPPVLHSQMIERAMQAGKHVICEKPHPGYFSRDGDAVPIGRTVDRGTMYETVLRDMDRLRGVITAAGGKFMYAENFVYAPSTLLAADRIRQKKSKILFMKGEESLKGSSSPLAGRWDKTGGGSLMRVGCHPLAGMLWLKGVEAQARGEAVTIKSVVADTGIATAGLTETEHRHIDIRPHDVEDMAVVSITFSDDSKAMVMATDVCLGGAKNYMELYCNDGNYICNMTPIDALRTYYPDDGGTEPEFGLSTNAGWNNPLVADDVMRGYVGEFQDFIECVAYGREPLSGFELAYNTTKVIYAAYRSAQTGSRIIL